MDENTEMQKNPEENFTTVEVDPITGEYYINIPEWVLNDFGWYEGTQVNMEVEGDCIVITEIKERKHENAKKSGGKFYDRRSRYRDWGVLYKVARVGTE